MNTSTVDDYKAAITDATGRLLGIDVSRWNGKGNWAKVKAAGISFAFIRAGSIPHVGGSPYTDDLFLEHSNGASSAAIPFGLYWYFRPYQPVIKQARYFADLYLSLGGTALPPVCDIEVVVGMTTDNAADALLTFLVALQEYTKRQPIIYTRQSVFDVYIAKNVLWQKYKLWAARYNTALSSPWSDGRFVFRDWMDWVFWQYSADNNAEAINYGFGINPPIHAPDAKPEPDIDLNWYNGDKQRFEQEFGITIPTPEPPGCSPFRFKVLANVLNMRTGPGTSYKDIGDLHKGDVLEVDSFAGSDVWARIAGTNTWFCVKQGNTIFAEVV